VAWTGFESYGNHVVVLLSGQVLHVSVSRPGLPTTCGLLP